MGVSPTTFKPGQTGNKNGRPPGASTHTRFCDQLIKLGYDPVEAMVEIARHPEVKWDVRQKAAAELLCRKIPSLRAIEHSGTIASTFNLNVLMPEQNDGSGA